MCHRTICGAWGLTLLLACASPSHTQGSPLPWRWNVAHLLDAGGSLIVDWKAICRQRKGGKTAGIYEVVSPSRVHPPLLQCGFWTTSLAACSSQR